MNTNISKQFAAMVANYEQLAAQIMPVAQPVTPEDDPLKFEWAKQEGFNPEYDPNTDQVTWVQQPKPAYQAPDIMKMQGSMSIEQLHDSYPMFKVKAERLDPLIQEIIQKTLDGEISMQRANELALQLATDTFDDAVKQTGKQGLGAGAKSSSMEQTFDKIGKAKVAG